MKAGPWLSFSLATAVRISTNNGWYLAPKMKIHLSSLVWPLRWTWDGDSGRMRGELADTLVRAAPTGVSQRSWRRADASTRLAIPVLSSLTKGPEGAVICCAPQSQPTGVSKSTEVGSRGMFTCHLESLLTRDPTDQKWTSSCPPSCLSQAFPDWVIELSSYWGGLFN